jgi:hypothetical protein
MKPFAVVGLLLLTLAVGTKLSAQVSTPLVSIVVGENTPTTSTENIAGLNAQQFTLSSGAYVSNIQLTLIGDILNPAGGNNCAFTYAITNQLNTDGSLGTSWLQANGSVTLGTTLTLAPFSAAFPLLYLPAGTYYVVVNTTPASGACRNTTGDPELFWSLNPTGSPQFGTVGLASIYNGHWQTEASTVFDFDLSGPVILPPPVGGGLAQIARLVVEGPAKPGPGVPVQVQLGFADMKGNPLGTTSTVSLGPGQIQSLDLPLGQFVKNVGDRIEVQPLISQASGATAEVVPPIRATVQLLDQVLGVESLEAPLPQAGASSLELVPQALSAGLTMRLNVAATRVGSCIGQLGFSDLNGSPLGPTLAVNLSQGTGTSLDLTASSLGLTTHPIEVQPIVSIAASPTGGPQTTSVCQTSVEVFDRLTGRTQSYQSTLVAAPVQ